MLLKIILLSLFISPFILIGQTNTNNPFTSRGLGELNPLSHSIFGGLGNVSTPLIDSAQLNSENPSSYSFLGKGQPIFSIGLTSSFSNFKQNSLTSIANFISLNHFTLGMSVSNRFGICFGLKPYSSTGYQLKGDQISGVDTLHYSYSGSGGYSNAYFGFSYKLLQIHKHTVSLGTNIGYIFGVATNEIVTSLSSSSIGGIRERTQQIKSANFDFGASYQYKINRDHAFVFGGTYSPSQLYSTVNTNSLIYALSTSNVLGNDTLKYIKSIGNIHSPSIYSVGFKYDFTQNNKSNRNSDRSPQLQLSGELRMVDWKSYSTTQTTTDLLYSTIQYGIGFQFAPHYDFLDRSKNINLIHRMKYRVGAVYQTLPWKDNNVQLTNKAITFGFGIPIISQFSSSSINISCLYGQKWNGNVATLKENYLTVNFGVNITPASYERWFKKNKID